MRKNGLAARVATGLFLGSVALGGAGDNTPLKDLMRAKLERSQAALAAIAKADFELAESAARRLSALSESPAWRVSEAREYLRYTAAFRRSAQDLAKAAADRDIDAATLAYIRMTRVCVQCHKFTRAKRIVLLEQRPPGQGQKGAGIDQKQRGPLAAARRGLSRG